MTHLKFTFIVENKTKNELNNILCIGGNLNKLSSNISNTHSTTIIAEKGIAEKNKLILFNGQIISSKKDEFENEIIKFEQINIGLQELSTRTIKQAKMQYTLELKMFT